MTIEKKIIVSCEINSRIVGYYQTVINWNIGKEQEFKKHRYFDKIIDRNHKEEV